MLLQSGRVLKFAAQVALGSVVVAAVASRLVRRVEVEGDSMRPTLLPGDRLLVLRWGRPRPGQLAVIADPRQPGRLLVKRVAAVGPRGITVAGDNPGASTDSRVFGPLARIEGRPLCRYHPPGRAGSIGT